MASVQQLSDIELRKKLIEYGFDAGPVTGTTRKLFEKKLTTLMSQNPKPSPRKESIAPKVSRSLSRFSSAEEDSDDAGANTSRRKSIASSNSNSTGKKKFPGRTAAAAARAAQSEAQAQDSLLMPSPPAVPAPKEKLSRGRYSVVEPPTARKPPTPARSTRKSIATSSPMKPSHSINNGFDSGSDSDVPIRSSVRLSPLKTKLASDDDPNHEEDDEDDRPITSLLSNMSDKFLPSSDSTHRSSIDTGGDYVKHRLNVGRDASPIDSTDAPYLSAFARRLSQLKAHSLGSSVYDDVKESDSDDSFRGPTPSNGNYYKKSIISPTRTTARRVDPSRSFKTSEESVSFWRNSHVMSLLILGGFVLFGIGLFVMYVNVTTKESVGLVEESAVGNVYKICKDTEDVPGMTCVPQDKVAPAMKIFDTVYQELLARAVGAECGPAQDGLYPSAFLTEGETVQLVVERLGLSIWEAEEQVGNLVVLLSSNPHWGVSALETTVRHPDKTKLIASNPKIPLQCVLMNKAYGMLYSLAFILVGLGIIYGIVEGVRWFVRKREKRQQEVYHYVERIIEILSSHHQNLGPGDNPYLAISHVRDQLIPPQNRKQLKVVWDAAVDFIDSKESRVRSEIQPINGEDYKVWRWLPPRHNTSMTGSTAAESPATSPQTSNVSRHRKVWQGQAFGTMEGSMNNLPVSPTPCLKIRHMFDPDMETGENWPLQVQDAILEKCAGARILHVAVDKGSKEGCVYVKCASELDAGKAYKALHGSWFDSQLVTVKYLRLERYHERFPNAVKSVEALRPTNNLRLSLQSPDDD